MDAISQRFLFFNTQENTVGMAVKVKKNPALSKTVIIDGWMDGWISFQLNQLNE